MSQALHDFAVYGAFATVIAATFFPGSDPSARLLARVLTRATLEGWGWRLAFLVTLPLGLVGLYLRRRLDETPRFRAVQRARAVVRRPVAEAVRGYPGRLLTGLALVAIAAPFLGRLSDRVGRRPLLVAGTLALLVVTLPAFLATLLVRRTGNPVTPAFYAVAVAVAAVVAALLTRETAFRPLDTD